MFSLLKPSPLVHLSQGQKYKHSGQRHTCTLSVKWNTDVRCDVDGCIRVSITVKCKPHEFLRFSSDIQSPYV